ncbi:ATP-grasp domain-containing protein [Sporosarcina sp. CAU 1771]
MKGYVYYTEIESVRNQLFIEDLINEAEKIGIDLRLLIGEEVPSQDASFILYRDRDSKRAFEFEAEGFRLFNRSEVNKIANNKLRTFELATLLGVPVLPTKRVRKIEEINSYPVVLKTVDGHGGNEVFLCSTEADADKVFDLFTSNELIVQPYIESGARDIRVFMIGEDVVGAVKRTGNGSFKSNYTLGGSVEKYALSSSQEKDAKTIARAIKSDYIGIDFLLLPDGSWLLNEIEDPVGARSFYSTHDESIAQALMLHIKKQISIHTE